MGLAAKFLRGLAFLLFVAAGLAAVGGIVVTITQSADAEQRGMSVAVGLVYGCLIAVPGVLLHAGSRHLMRRGERTPRQLLDRL